MKKINRIRLPLAALALLAVLGYAPSRAGILALAAGQGNIVSQNERGVFVRYLPDAPVLFGQAGYYDLALGHWDGPTHNTAVSIGRGLRWGSPRRIYFAAEIGVGYIDRVTEHLGTRGEFALGVAVGHRFGAYDLSLEQVHYSNGKLAFAWSGPNRGENFLTLQVGRAF